MSKKILVIARDFPPIVHGGSLRAGKIVKCLRIQGSQVFVLTVDSHPIFSDWELFKDASLGIKIFKVPSWEIICLLKNFLFNLKRKNKKGKQEIEKIFRPNFIQQPLINKIWSTFLKWQYYFLWPDPSVLWLPNCYKKGKEMINKYGIEMIYCFAPPHSVSLAGYLLSRKKKIPLIIDLADNWTDNELFRSRIWIKNKIEKYWEKLIFRNASYILFSSQAAKKSVVRRYPQHQKKLVVIENFFDPDDFRFQKAEKQADKLYFLYTGAVGLNRHSPTNFLTAIFKVLKNNKRLAKIIKVKFVGDFLLDQKYWRKQLPKTLIISKYQNHLKCIKLLNKASILIVIVEKKEGGEMAIPLKTYEYLRSGKPILALCPRISSLASLIRKTKSGWVVDIEDIRAIEKTIKIIIKWWENNKDKKIINKRDINQYSLKKTGEKINCLLNNLVKNER